MEIRPLREDDDRSSFRSGDPDLDRFFARYAGQNQFRHHLGTTWVAVREETLVGFATVAAAHLELTDLPATSRGRLPAYPLPVLRLARVAVAADAQGMGVGRALLRGVFTIARQMASNVGCVGVVVDAKAEAESFYASLGFVALEVRQGASGARPEPRAMFLALKGIPRMA